MKRGALFIACLILSILLVVTGVLMLGRTFKRYNDMVLMEQDMHLQEMAEAVDENIAVQLNSFREELMYVINRRGFLSAEAVWLESGEKEELLFRMQENLVGQNPLIHTMLAMQDGEIILSTNGSTDFLFPSKGEGMLQPCFAGDGTMYLAVFSAAEQLDYAALIDVARWYAELARVNTSDQIHLMLLGSREKLLLHQWQQGTFVTAVEELTADNCDVQAVRYMMECRNSGKALTATYHISYPGDSFVHEMRMTVIPLEACVNGYFIVGLTSDYDEVIRPMQQAAIQMIGFGGMVIAGVLLIVLITLNMLHMRRRQDQELQRLIEKNAETRQLLERTQELAHHQRLETIGTLTSSIAHEFNNLLTPIMGYSILTLEGLSDADGELADNVAEIYEASRKAKTIISRLSDLSRKNVEVTFCPVSLKDVVDKALQVAAPAQPAHVTTALHAQAADCRILGNETQLSQMLLNLILNAFHAMEKKGGVLAITISREADWAVLTVRDGGEGIAEDALPHIFEPFFTTKESGRGTGLGLAIVQQVVESHRGRIDVESRPGEGSCFTLRFPEEPRADS